jgi:hypothetical protein
MRSDPKGLMQKHLLAIAVILTVGTGCDNVEWGGVSMELQPPPEPETDSASAPDSTSLVPDNVDGPILLAGARDSLGIDFVLVGEALPGGVRPFPDPQFPEDVARLTTLTAPGVEWVLFSAGVRVGRLIVESASQATAFCGQRPALRGVVELVPEAADAQRFLAMPAEFGSTTQYAPFRPVEHDYDQRVATLDIATEALRSLEARRPLSILDARRDIQALQLDSTTGETVAATFMYEDDLEVGPPDGGGAYALFILAQQRNGAVYDEAFSWYRAVDTEGKGAPRYFDHLDWDGDGADEILLEVLGANRRWFAALDRDGGTWARDYQDPCGSGSGSVADSN